MSRTYNILLILTILLYYVHGHIVDYSKRKIYSFTILYERYVYSDFGKNENDLQGAIFNLNITEISFSNHQTDCRLYFMLLSF